MHHSSSPLATGGARENRQQGNGRESSGRGQEKTMFRAAHRPGEELGIGRFFRNLRGKWTRLWTALKFQFHRKTLHVFERRAVRQAAMLGACAFILFYKESVFVSRLAGPVFSLLRPEGQRIGDDYPPSEFSYSGSRAGQPAAKKTNWSGILGVGGNEAAPIAAGQLTEAQANDYIEKYSGIARAEMEKYGIPASIGLAQGLVESRAGLSKLAQRNNNHFGMKCFSKKCPKGHCTNMTDDHHKDFFRKYGSAWESWREHSRLLSSGHYQRLHKYGRDYQQWAYGLKALGYATDRTYAEKLIGMIERYRLDRFDK